MLCRDNTPPGISLANSFLGTGGEVTCVAWIFGCSRSQDYLASGSTDRSITIWDPVRNRQFLRWEAHSKVVQSIAYKDGLLASGSWDGTAKIWKLPTVPGNQDRATLLRTLEGHGGTIWDLTFLPNGRLATASSDKTIRIWDYTGAQDMLTLSGHDGAVFGLQYLPETERLLSVSGDRTLRLWNPYREDCETTIGYHDAGINVVAVSPDGNYACTGSTDTTIRVWNLRDFKSGGPLETLTEHKAAVTGLSFSSDGRILVSKSNDGTVRFWDTKDVDKWRCVAHLNEICTGGFPAPCSCHPKEDKLISLGENQRAVLLWNIEPVILCRPQNDPFTYRAAKIVLLGDSGVGKSALSRSLARMSFVPTESTHGREVRRMWQEYVQSADKEIREILIWDLAGQVACRPIHNLSLGSVCIALVVYDPRSEVDPLACIRYWTTALKLVGLEPNRVALVASRSDLPSVSASTKDLDRFQPYFRISVSSKEMGGPSVNQLRLWIQRNIPWESIDEIKGSYLIRSLSGLSFDGAFKNRAIYGVNQYYLDYCQQLSVAADSPDKNLFVAALCALERLDLVKLILKREFVLFQPETLDGAATKVLERARASGGEVDIDTLVLQAEESPLLYDWSSEDRTILFKAAIEELENHHFAFRPRPENDPSRIAFPTVCSKPVSDRELLPRSLTFRFEGVLESSYSSLVVQVTARDRKRYPEVKPDLRRGALLQSLPKPYDYAICAESPMEGIVEISLHCHRSQRAELGATVLAIIGLFAVGGQPNIIEFEPIQCSLCRWMVPHTVQRELRTANVVVIHCPSCRAEISLSKGTTQNLKARFTGTEKYDVFLSCCSDDLEIVREVKATLEERWHATFFLYDDSMPPGMDYTEATRKVIEQTKTFIIFLGQHLRKPQREEISYMISDGHLKPDDERVLLPVYLAEFSHEKRLSHQTAIRAGHLEPYEIAEMVASVLGLPRRTKRDVDEAV